jgi:hypothetical protein
MADAVAVRDVRNASAGAGDLIDRELGGGLPATSP